MTQKEITYNLIVPDKNGTVFETGWLRNGNIVYNKKDVKSSLFKVKEWDNYIFTSHDIAISFTISDLGYAGALCVSFADYANKLVHSETEIVLFPNHSKFGLGNSPKLSTGEWHTEKLDIIFKNREEGKRCIICNYKNFYEGKNLAIDIDIEDPPQESITVVNTAVDKPQDFVINTKKNCLEATGTVTFGDRIIQFEKNSCFGCFNWCRGSFSYNNKTYWATGSGKIEGEPFGFNLGYRLFEKEDVNENAVFYKGKVHKLDKIGFIIPKNEEGKPDYMGVWRLTSNDGRFEGEFIPIVERTSCIDVKFLVSDQHQVFGRMIGKATLDDGTKIEFSDFISSMEVIRNKC